MAAADAPIIAIVGNVKAEGASDAGETLGRELAKAGFRILVYSSGGNFLEAVGITYDLDSLFAKLKP